jgi:arylsulfatase A-like enzyme/Flp pilus assembly protein TadD
MKKRKKVLGGAPASSPASSASTNAGGGVGAPLRYTVAICMVIIIATGVYLMFRRQRATAGPAHDIILITIDTLRADSVGFAGNTKVKTPFLDSLAARGIVYTNAHAHNVVTLPSHVNILTGLYPYQHGVRDNAGFVLDPKIPTLATMLKQSGWATGAFVGAFPLDSRFGLNHGFDVYDDNYGKGDARVHFVIQERIAGEVLRPAMKWWSDNAGRKRFMWIHLYDVHAPYRPPQPFFSQYISDLYLGEVAYVDHALSETLGPLLEHDPNTFVVITADHGEGRGDHGELTHGLFAYEPTLKIPLLVVGPGIEPRREAEYVRHVDIAPTILSRAGVAVPKTLPGQSLLEKIGSRDSYFESLSASINRGWAPLTGVIHDREKYIDLPITELYDLPKDPAEAHNLREERRRDVEAARRILADALAAVAPVHRKITADEIAKLRSLGYFTGGAAAKSSYGAEDDPKNLIPLNEMMHKVIDAYEKNDVPTALKTAKQLVAERPSMMAGRELLAFMLQETDDIGGAIEQLRTIVANNSASEDEKVTLALLLSETGNSSEAVKLLAPISSSSNPDLLNAYGVALADEGKVNEAVKQFERAFTLDKNNAPALQNLGIVALRKDDVPAAQSYLSRALELNPRLPLALNTMGVVYARMGDFPHAVEYWNRAVSLDPHQYDALLNIGIVEGRAGHKEEARRALGRFVDTAPKSHYASDIEAARHALITLQ